MIVVYHNERFMDNWPGREPVLGRLTKVAWVETDDLDVAYEATNTIDRPWYSTGGRFRFQTHVLPVAQDGCRSTSVGDILVTDDAHVFIVASFGFTEIDPSLIHLFIKK